MAALSRAYAGEGDQPLMGDLLEGVSPLSRHLVDYPWRLSAQGAEAERDVHFWFVGGALAGLAAWQQWWATLDFYVRPGPRQDEVAEALFAWAAQRFAELDAARGHPLPYWAEAREDDAARLALLERHGYRVEDDYAYIMLGRTLDGPLPRHTPPPGFTIRPLAGQEEAEVYAEVHRQAFASTAMTAEWRRRTLRMPLYRRDLDLLAVAPDGRPAGFCVGWFAARQSVVQIEPLGVDPAFQGRGLSQALLGELFARAHSLGATQALVETESSRSPAQHAYEAAGFRPLYRSLRKGQWMTSRMREEAR